MKKLIFTTISVMGLAASAIAADWTEVGSLNDKSTVLIDKETVSKKKDTITFFSQVKYSEEGAEKVKAELGLKTIPTSSKSEEAINCASRTIMTVRTLIYSKDGNVLFTEQGTPYATVVPESIGEAKFKALCSQQATSPANAKAPSKASNKK